MEKLFTEPVGWIGLLGSMALMVVGHVGRKYLLPFLSIGKRQRYAGFVAMIADEITDDLRAKYPDREWTEWLDEAVDLVVDICEVGPDVARRAISAAVARKQAASKQQ